jgi:hypothetical protein
LASIYPNSLWISRSGYFAGFLLSAFVSTSSAQVDLRGKKGEVNPADLKKYDPKEPSLKIKEPPPPKSDPPAKSKEVHQEKQHRHGSDEPPPGGGAPVPARPPLYAPPPRPVGS